MLDLITLIKIAGKLKRATIKPDLSPEFVVVGIGIGRALSGKVGGRLYDAAVE